MLKQFVVESEFATSYKDTRRNSTLSQAGEVFGTAVLVVLLGAAHVRLAAQSTFGSIVGTVRDSSGAAVGGAEVSTRRVDNNYVRTAISDQAGTYQVLNLKPGRYEVTVAKRWNASQSFLPLQRFRRQVHRPSSPR